LQFLFKHVKKYFIVQIVSIIMGKLPIEINIT